MADKIAVTLNETKGQWEVRQGSKGISHHRTQAEANVAAQALAKKHGVGYVLYDKHGKVVEKK